jgi:hypothetical protein
MSRSTSTRLAPAVAIALAAVLTPLSASAQFRTGSQSWISAPTGEITFSGLADDALVTDQYFASSGVTFTNVELNSTSVFFADAPYVRNTVGTSPYSPVTIRWESAVFSIAWLGAANSGLGSIEGFLNGAPVIQSDAQMSVTPSWFGFENIWLDAIRITAPTTTNGIVALDNLQWFRPVLTDNEPPLPPSSVPEPAALLLLGVGLVGIMLRRRRLVT